ncbi:hypothetical protein TNCV_3820771 [Trichonephila clavipes]|nr:hypothetical protein TNCV_3820771 [Trichonephila clavipes]
MTKFAPIVGAGNQHYLVDAVGFPSYPRHAQLERDMVIRLSKRCLICYKTVHSNTLRVVWHYLAEKSQGTAKGTIEKNSSQNVVDVPLCCTLASNDDQRVRL